MAEKELEKIPCPFCGNKFYSICVEETSVGDMYFCYVICSCGGRTGPVYYANPKEEQASIEKAINLWKGIYNKWENT